MNEERQPRPTSDATRTCRRCLRELPPERFRHLSAECRRDSYCLDCRRDIVRQATARRREELGRLASRPDDDGRPVITREENPAFRRALILRALRRVEESKARKLAKATPPERTARGDGHDGDTPIS
ncbi:MAG: hypothetical protein LBN29_03735 [Mediterranea sp.]|jgi:hypothetical protein|nr:hypothetical protein [Mediterranea sp.]